MAAYARLAPVISHNVFVSWAAHQRSYAHHVVFFQLLLDMVSQKYVASVQVFRTLNSVCKTVLGRLASALKENEALLQTGCADNCMHAAISRFALTDACNVCAGVQDIEVCLHDCAGSAGQS